MAKEATLSASLDEKIWKILEGMEDNSSLDFQLLETLASGSYPTADSKIERVKDLLRKIGQSDASLRSDVLKATASAPLTQVQKDANGWPLCDWANPKFPVKDLAELKALEGGIQIRKGDNSKIAPLGFVWYRGESGKKFNRYAIVGFGFDRNTFGRTVCLAALTKDQRYQNSGFYIPIESDRIKFGDTQPKYTPPID